MCVKLLPSESLNRFSKFSGMKVRPNAGLVGPVAWVKATIKLPSGIVHVPVHSDDRQFFKPFPHCCGYEVNIVFLSYEPAET